MPVLSPKRKKKEEKNTWSKLFLSIWHCIYFYKLKKVVFGGSNGRIGVYSKEGQFVYLQGNEHSNRVRRLKTLPHVHFFASCSWDSSIKLWDKKSLSYIGDFSIQRNNVSVNALELIDNETIVGGYSDGHIIIWHITFNNNSNTLVQTQPIKILNTPSMVLSLKVLPKNFLASGHEDGRVVIWNLTDYQNFTIFKGNYESIWDIELIDEVSFAMACSNHRILVKNFITGELIHNLTGHSNKVISLKLLPSASNLLASGSWDDTIIIWDLNSGQLKTVLRSHQSSVYALDVYDKEKDILVSGSFDLTLKFWRISTGQLLETINTNLNIWSLVLI